jgi:phytoene/squalene synthetase
MTNVSTLDAEDTKCKVWGLSASGRRSVSERIAAKDRNNLYLTSLLFQDKERYRAFCAMYAVMRVIDDAVDALPLSGDFVPDPVLADPCRSLVDSWQSAIAAGCPTAMFPQGLCAELFDALNRFPTPLELWHDFFGAMRRDLATRVFATPEDFDGYCQGASGSPTTIYLFLLAAQRDEAANGEYRVPHGFPLLTAGRALGHFAYLAHILRDLAEDSTNGLLYLPLSDLAEHGLDFAGLQHAARTGKSPQRLLDLVRLVVTRSRASLHRANAMLAPHRIAAADCRVILALIIGIYEAVLDKIEACGYEVMDRSGRHQLTLVDKTMLFQMASRQEAYS